MESFSTNEAHPFKESINSCLTLLDLPLEILSHIACFLDITGVRSLRQTNKTLRDAIQSRSVWLALAQQLVTRNLPDIYPDYETIEYLSTKELEEWTTRRLLVESRWTKEQEFSPRRRVIHMTQDEETKGHTSLLLVPGGRWLLEGTGSGAVLVYDLGALAPRPMLLIEPPEDACEYRPHTRTWLIFTPAPAIKLHVLERSPRMKFLLFFGHVCVPDDAPSWFQKVYIWEVQVNGHGSAAALSAEKKVALNMGTERDFALPLQVKADLLVRGIVGRSVEQIEILRWKDCTEERLVRATIVCADVEWAQALNDRVLGITRDSIVIYNIPPFRSTNVGEMQHHDHIPQTVPMWTYPLPRRRASEGREFTYSQVFFDGEAYRLVIDVLGAAIFGVTIPADQADLPSVEVLLGGNHIPSRATCLGLSRGFSLRKDGKCVTYRYCWSNEGGETGASGERAPEVGPNLDTFEALGFDEGSGRAVLPYESYFHVLDFV